VLVVDDEEHITVAPVHGLSRTVLSRTGIVWTGALEAMKHHPDLAFRRNAARSHGSTSPTASQTERLDRGIPVISYGPDTTADK